MLPGRPLPHARNIRRPSISGLFWIISVSPQPTSKYPSPPHHHIMSPNSKRGTLMNKYLSQTRTPDRPPTHRLNPLSHFLSAHSIPGFSSAAPHSVPALKLDRGQLLNHRSYQFPEVYVGCTPGLALLCQFFLTYPQSPYPSSSPCPNLQHEWKHSFKPETMSALRSQALKSCGDSLFNHRTRIPKGKQKVGKKTPI